MKTRRNKALVGSGEFEEVNIDMELCDSYYDFDRFILANCKSFLN